MWEHHGARTCGDYDAIGADLRVVVHLDGVFVDKFGVSHDAFAFVPRHHVFHHKADETVALGFHAVHHFRAVHAHGRFVQMHAERVGVQRVVPRFGGGNHQLGGHAAHARAGGAEYVAFNQINIGRVQQGIAVCAHACRAAANHYNVCLDLFHVGLLSGFR